jgi:MOSC domain-containing protein YiiM
MTGEGTIRQLSVSPGGVPKRAIPAAMVTLEGLEGDGHRNTRLHGGLERAVCLFPSEAIRRLAAEGHSITPGAIGENVTTEGLDWSLVVPDAYLLLGQRVVLRVTRYTTPCATIAGVFIDRESSRVSQKHHPGWSRVYARVVAGGELRAGDAVRLVSQREAEAERLGAACPDGRGVGPASRRSIRAPGPSMRFDSRFGRVLR